MRRTNAFYTDLPDAEIVGCTDAGALESGQREQENDRARPRATRTDKQPTNTALHRTRTHRDLAQSDGMAGRSGKERRPRRALGDGTVPLVATVTFLDADLEAEGKWCAAWMPRRCLSRQAQETRAADWRGQG